MKHKNITPSTIKITSKNESRNRKSIILKLPPVNNAEMTHFSCTYCDEYFTQKHLLLRHQKLHKTLVNQRNSDGAEEEEEEEESDSDGKRETLKCLQQREEKQLYCCEQCGVDCESRSALVQHLKAHNKQDKGPLVCAICGKEFRFKCLLTQHMMSHEFKIKFKKSLSCRVCGKLYNKSGSLAKHELQHEGKGSFRCRPCGEIFATKTERAQHKEEKHEKSWKCFMCHHMFATESKLETHQQWHETKGAEMFLCNLCGKEFKLKVNLKVHMESRCGTEPQHVCKVCNKAFMTRGTLVTHSLLHTGEKTFLCRFCGKNFRLKVEMQRHERSHTGEKPYVCKVCNKAFAHRESLVTHNTLHTGIRPYMCEVCGSTFSCIGNLIKHRKTHRIKCGLIDTKSITPNIMPKIDLFTTSSTALVAAVSNKPAEILPVAPMVMPRNNVVTNEASQFIQGNYYGYRSAGYENNLEWIPPLFTPNDPIMDRIPMSIDLDPGNLDKNMKSSHCYWGANNGLVISPDLTQQPFTSYGNFIRDPMKPESSFRDLQLCEPPQDLTANHGRQVGSFFHNLDCNKFDCTDRTDLTNVYPHIPAERMHDGVKLMGPGMAHNLESTLNTTHYQTPSSIVCDNPLPQPSILPDNPPVNIILPGVCESPSNLLGTNMIEDSISEVVIGVPTIGLVNPPVYVPDSELKSKFSDIASPLNHLSNNELSPESVSLDLSVDTIKLEELGKCDELPIETIIGDQKKYSPFQVEEDKEDDDSGSESESDKTAINSGDDYITCISTSKRENNVVNNVEGDTAAISLECTLKTEEDASGNESDSNEEATLELRTEKQSSDINKKYHCEYCNKEFNFISRLNRHKKCHAVKSKETASCQFCGRKYTNEACLVKHELQHSNSGVYKCKECNEKFNTKAEYRSHRAKQHGKQWNCTVCERSFSTSSNLKNHTNNKHLGREAVPSYVCHICGKLFKQKGNLKLHVDSRCGTDPQHVCNVCGKAFMSFGSLGTHQLLHTGEKTFLCRFCGKNYRLKVEMQRHERSHTGEKPFVCKVCHKAFAHRESLVTHNTLHTGIRPYMCEACGSTFSCIGNLIKHRQTHNRRCDLARAGQNSILPD